MRVLLSLGPIRTKRFASGARSRRTSGQTRDPLVPTPPRRVMRRSDSRSSWNFRVRSSWNCWKSNDRYTCLGDFGGEPRSSTLKPVFPVQHVFWYVPHGSSQLSLQIPSLCFAPSARCSSLRFQFICLHYDGLQFVDLIYGCAHRGGPSTGTCL